MAIINTNLASLTASRSLQQAQQLQETSMERLSTGLRINSAADDATGLGIAEGMTSQIRGLNMAINNAGAAVNLVDTADSALSETGDILQRMRELSVQAGNSTLSTSDRSALKVEMEALTAELDRIASTTSYNKNNLLDGSASALSFQVGDGTSAPETIGLSIDSAKSADLGLNTSSTSTANNGTLVGAFANDSASITDASVAVDDIFINGVDWAVSLTTEKRVGDDGSVNDVTFATETAGGLAQAINTNTAGHGVTASATTVVEGTFTNGVFAANAIVMEVTNNAGTQTLHTFSATNSVDELIQQIVTGGGETAQAIENITAVKNSAGGITVTATDGQTIEFATGGATAGFTTNVHTGKITLESVDGTSPISITRGDNTTAKDSDLRVLGFNVQSDPSVLTGLQVKGTDLQVLGTDSMTVNGVQIGATDTTVAGAATAKDLADAINAVSAESGVTATAKTELFLNMTMASGSNTLTQSAAGALTINGVAMSDTSGSAGSGATVASIVTEINSVSTSAGLGITAELHSAGVIKLTHSTGGDITILEDATLADGLLDSVTHADGSSLDQTGASASFGAASTFTFAGQLTLTNTSGGAIELGYSDVSESVAQDNWDKLGFRAGVSSGVTTTATNGVDVSTVAAATAALTAIDAAIDKVSEIRGGLGALSNRLDHTVNNLTAAVENHSASRSQIMDADFATESAALAKAQVLSQASTAMLAQANAAPQLVLQLLQ